MSNCWEGFASREEEERENDWVPPSDLTDGDMEWAPNPVDKPEPWKAEEWPKDLAGPEYWLWRRLLEEDDDLDPEQ